MSPDVPLHSTHPVRAPSGPPPALLPPPPIAPFEEAGYGLRFARDEADLEAVQRLRFEVFNRELNEGFEASWASGLDRDPFDAQCHHLMLEAPGGPLVGTYRVQTRQQAEQGRGFYCDQEYDLSTLEPVTDRGVEVGRACIARDHRNGAALFALWRGLARTLERAGKRYLFGCCSLTSRDPREGWALEERLQAGGHVHPTWRVLPRELHRCVQHGRSDDPVVVTLPRLFATYLRYGARVCSPPAVDHEFGTIDWLVVLDARTLPARLWRLFFGDLFSSPEAIDAAAEEELA
jgi:putative hemolysin